MKKLTLILLIACCFGCSKLKYGNVIEKEYHPDFFTIILISQTTTVGKTTMTTFTQIPVYYPESWSIDVKGVSTEGKPLTKTFYIPKAEYDTTQIGRFICVEDKCDERKYVEK